MDSERTNADRITYARTETVRALRMIGNALNEQREEQAEVWLELARKRLRNSLRELEAYGKRER